MLIIKVGSKLYLFSMQSHSFTETLKYPSKPSPSPRVVLCRPSSMTVNVRAVLPENPAKTLNSQAQKFRHCFAKLPFAGVGWDSTQISRKLKGNRELLESIFGWSMIFAYAHNANNNLKILKHLMNLGYTAVSWFAALCSSVPSIAMLTKSALMPKNAMAFSIPTFILGLVISSLVWGILMKAMAEREKVAAQVPNAGPKAMAEREKVAAQVPNAGPKAKAERDKVAAQVVVAVAGAKNFVQILVNPPQEWKE